jgi:hypothetical protein
MGDDVGRERFATLRELVDWPGATAGRPEPRPASNRSLGERVVHAATIIQGDVRDFTPSSVRATVPLLGCHGPEVADAILRRLIPQLPIGSTSVVVHDINTPEGPRPTLTHLATRTAGAGSSRLRRTATHRSLAGRAWGHTGARHRNARVHRLRRRRAAPRIAAKRPGRSDAGAITPNALEAGHESPGVPASIDLSALGRNSRASRSNRAMYSR